MGALRLLDCFRVLPTSLASEGLLFFEGRRVGRFGHGRPLGSFQGLRRLREALLDLSFVVLRVFRGVVTLRLDLRGPRRPCPGRPASLLRRWAILWVMASLAGASTPFGGMAAAARARGSEGGCGLYRGVGAPNGSSDLRRLQLFVEILHADARRRTARRGRCQSRRWPS